jgi:hypothetical protein
MPLDFYSAFRRTNRVNGSYSLKDVSEVEQGGR